MTIEKFEVGKKYKLVDREGWELNGNYSIDNEYYGFEDDIIIFSRIDSDGDGWVGGTCAVTFKDEAHLFELVEEYEETPQIVPDNNVDAIETQSEPTTLTGKETTLEALREANNPISVCPLWAMKQLCSENDINIEVQNCGDIYVHLAHSDESYKVKDMKELTSVLDAVKLLESFKED